MPEKEEEKSLEELQREEAERINALPEIHDILSRHSLCIVDNTGDVPSLKKVSKDALLKNLKDSNLSPKAQISLSKVGSGQITDQELQSLKGAREPIQEALDTKAHASHFHSTSDLVDGVLSPNRGGLGTTLEREGYLVSKGGEISFVPIEEVKVESPDLSEVKGISLINSQNGEVLAYDARHKAWINKSLHDLPVPIANHEHKVEDIQGTLSLEQGGLGKDCSKLTGLLYLDEGQVGALGYLRSSLTGVDDEQTLTKKTINAVDNNLFNLQLSKEVTGSLGDLKDVLPLEAKEGDVLRFVAGSWVPETLILPAGKDESYTPPELGELSKLDSVDSEQIKESAILPKHLPTLRPNTLLGRISGGLGETEEISFAELKRAFKLDVRQPGAPTSSVEDAVTHDMFRNNGVVVRTSLGTYVNRNIIGQPGQIDVLNPDGVSDNFVIKFPNKGIQVPGGSEEERPSRAMEGTLRANTTDHTLEYYNGSEWVKLT